MTLGLVLLVEMLLALGVLVLLSPCWHHRWMLWTRKDQRAREIQPDCDALGPTYMPKWIGLAWLAWGVVTIGQDLYRMALGRLPWSAWQWHGLVGWLLFGVADLLWAAQWRWQVARVVVDMFELDEILLPAVKSLYANAVEPHRAAYQVAHRAAYDYIALVAWGARPCDWGYSYKILPLSQSAGWQVPIYPWLQAIGGPALLDEDAQIMLVIERLDRPLPAPLLRGPTLGTPRCPIWQRHKRPHLWARTSAPPLSRRGGPEEEEGRWSPYAYFRFNAVLPKFGRVRYPVLIRLRPARTQPKTILVRTNDGIPLQLPQVEVTFDLFAQGRLVRDAFKELPPQQAHALAWQAVHRLIQREASHWDIHTATDLARRVMEGALDSTIRKVFAKYKAAQLLDRVHQKTLHDLLAAWPEEVRQPLERRLRTYFQRADTVTPERMRQEILEAFNGRAEDGFPLAEQRGLKVVDITFGDWAPPRSVRELLYASLRNYLNEKRGELPSQVQARMQRELLAAAEHFLRRARDLLPVVTLEEWSHGSWKSPNDALRALCRAWRRLLDETLLRPLAAHFQPPEPTDAVLYTEDILPRLTSADLNTEDPLLRERYLTQWLYEAWQVLQSCMPDTEMALGGPQPIHFLPDDPESV